MSWRRRFEPRHEPRLLESKTSLAVAEAPIDYLDRDIAGHPDLRISAREQNR